MQFYEKYNLKKHKISKLQFMRNVFYRVTSKSILWSTWEKEQKLEDLWKKILFNFTFVLKLIMVEYFIMEVDQGFVKIYWTYSCMSRKLLKLISDGQKSIEVNHGQLLKLIMVKQKTIDIIQGQLLKLFSVKENSVEFITLLKLLLFPV